MLAGIAFVHLLGIESDEALFANVFYEPPGGDYSYRLGSWRLPFMILSYLGTLKSWIYRPIYLIFGVGTGSTRVPAVLAGALSLWLFYRLLDRIAGRRAALIGCGLLATDAVYLLTCTFDWGPDVLQHVLTLGGVLLLTRFWQQQSERALAAAFFLFGLALWDKALAVWTLSGMGVAALATLSRQLWERITLRRLGVATLSLCVGALPLILYNIHTRGGTLNGNAVYDPAGLPQKVQTLAFTFRGSGLFGYLTPEDWQTPRAHAPREWIQQSSAALASYTGKRRESLLLYGFGVSLLLILLARGSDLRALIFALVAFAVAWLQMALVANTGGGLHHTVLIWPLPQAIMAISFASASRRLGRAGIPAVAAVTAVLMGSGLLVINTYYVQMVRNRGAIAWTDAIFPLADYLKRAPAAAIYCLDWGMLDSLRMLSDNHLPVRVGDVPLAKGGLTASERASLLYLVSLPDNLFLTHEKGFEFYPGVGAKLVQLAESAGYRQEMLAKIADSNGRETFEVFRFRRR